MDLTRRRLIRLAAYAVTLPGALEFFHPWLHAAGGGQHYAPPDPGKLRDYEPKFFGADDFAALEAFTAILIPTDDTPGAREARVVDFIDRALTSFAADQRALFETGLADLNARAGAAGFPALPAADAIALLAALEAEGSPFFEAVRVATITGYLANPEYGGNAGKVGWQAIGFDDRFVWSAPFGWYDGEGAAEE